MQIRVGDGSQGWAEYAPFDAILVSAATPEMPPALFAQLRDGGRMIVPIGPPSSQELQLIRKVRRTARGDAFSKVALCAAGVGSDG